MTKVMKALCQYSVGQHQVQGASQCSWNQEGAQECTFFFLTGRV